MPLPPGLPQISSFLISPLSPTTVQFSLCPLFLWLFACISPASTQLFAGAIADDDVRCAQFPDSPMCQQAALAGARGGQQPNPAFCNYQDLWLIPGKADASCRLPSSIFAKTEYQWLNVRGSESANCQNASVNGCGGFGNNCYYCDICDSLRQVDEQPDRSGLPNGVAEQLQGMNCPTEAGFYTFRKQFCFNDWRWLDADGDCRLDVLSETEDQSGLRAAMASLQQVRYGTVVAKVRMAYNATPEIARKKALKELQIERNALRELEQGGQRQGQRNWHAGGDGPPLPSDEFRRWYVAQRKGQWHREEYLPWLLYENEVACIRLTFDVCERAPQERWDGTGGYTCI